MEEVCSEMESEIYKYRSDQLGTEDYNCTYCSNTIYIPIQFTYEYPKWVESKNKILNDPSTLKYPFAIECDINDWYLFCRKVCYLNYKRKMSEQKDEEMTPEKKIKF